jgi:hypothetical protein
MDSNRVSVPKELHTADILYLLNYAICEYTSEQKETQLSK